MFHDLDVRVAQNERKSAVRALQKLGYDVIAFTTTIKGQKKITEKDIPKRQTYDDVDGRDGRNIVLHTDKSKRRRGVTVLERVTIVIDDISQLSILNSAELNKFDLVACSPVSEKLLQQCLQFDFDIISLPVEQRILFQLKRPNIHVAVEKGMLFEIGYASGLRDGSNLRTVVSNACNIVRATHGKHLLLSSGANSIMEMRAPLDVINLGVMMEIGEERARDAVVKNAKDIVKHGDIRARAHQGIVRVTHNDKKEIDAPKFEPYSQS